MKDELRRRVRAQRAGLGRDVVAARSKAAAERLVRALSASAPRCAVVALFAGIDAERELDPRPADAVLRASGITPVYPRVATRTPPALTFHTVTVPAELEAGPLGVPTPRADAPVVSLSEIDAFVVPGVAFTESGARLGYGGGYYDATLAAAPRARRIGYTHDEQLLGELPESVRDQRVDEIVLPDRTLACPPRSLSPRAPAPPGVTP